MARFRNKIKIKARRDYKRQVLLELLGEECVRCFTQTDLVFDHIDPKTKSFNIGMNMCRSLKNLIIEIKKCQLLCKSCHGQKTALERGRKLAHHGSETMYVYGCRCRPCKDAHAASARIRHRRRLLNVNS